MTPHTDTPVGGETRPRTSRNEESGTEDPKTFVRRPRLHPYLHGVKGDPDRLPELPEIPIPTGPDPPQTNPSVLRGRPPKPESQPLQRRPQNRHMGPDGRSGSRPRRTLVVEDLEVTETPPDTDAGHSPSPRPLPVERWGPGRNPEQRHRRVPSRPRFSNR